MKKQNSVLVWDISVRVFHWTLVLAFTVAYLTGEDDSSLHAYAGYTILVLLGYRIVWGLIGKRYARFSSFIYSPKETISYILNLIIGRPGHYLGHNPAGSLMVFALLISLGLSTITGLVVYGQEGKGPLATIELVSTAQANGDDNDHDQDEWIEELHEFFSNLTLLLVGIHIVGVFIAGKLEGQNLVKAMITGRKLDPGSTKE